jgi:hypothetical protein
MDSNEAAIILAEAKRYIKCTLCKGVRCLTCRGAICISKPAKCDGSSHCPRCLGVGALYNPKYVEACTVLKIPWDTVDKLKRKR